MKYHSYFYALLGFEIKQIGKAKFIIRKIYKFIFKWIIIMIIWKYWDNISCYPIKLKVSKKFSPSFSSSFSFLYCSAHMLMLGSSCLCQNVFMSLSNFLNAFQLKLASIEKCCHTQPSRFHIGEMLHQDAHISDEASVMYSRAKQVIM